MAKGNKLAFAGIKFPRVFSCNFKKNSVKYQLESNASKGN